LYFNQTRGHWSLSPTSHQWTSTHQRTIHWMDARYYSVVDEPQLS
jgi:hypothetical protein